MNIFVATTDGIEVQAEPVFVPEESDPGSQYFFFAYRILITNKTEENIQLLRRHWMITDARGQTREVEGDGVVGKQPVLKPGESFEYTSFCPLPTPSGTMRGTYEFQNQDGRLRSAEIPEFELVDPHLLRQMH